MNNTNIIILGSEECPACQLFDNILKKYNIKYYFVDIYDFLKLKSSEKNIYIKSFFENKMDLINIPIIYLIKNNILIRISNLSLLEFLKKKYNTNTNTNTNNITTNINNYLKKIKL